MAVGSPPRGLSAKLARFFALFSSASMFWYLYWLLVGPSSPDAAKGLVYEIWGRGSSHAFISWPVAISIWVLIAVHVPVALWGIVASLRKADAKEEAELDALLSKPPS